MKKIITSFILGLACFSLDAQCGSGGSVSLSSTATTNNSLAINSSSNHMLSQQFFNDAYAGKFSVEQSYANVSGSAFLADNSIDATLIMNDGTTYPNVPVQIDLYKQEVIATNAKGEEIYLNKEYFQEIIIPFEGKNISLRKINPEKPNQFYEVLYEDGDLVFFKERYVTRKEAMNNGMFKRTAEFTNRAKYFIKHDGGVIAKVKLKKKDIFYGFADAEVYAMKEYAKSNGLKFKEESDYVAVFEGVSK